MCLAEGYRFTQQIRSVYGDLARIRGLKAAPAFGSGGPSQQDFAEMLRFYAREVTSITERLVAGEIGPNQWSMLVDEAMLGAHTDAWQMGRFLAGVTGDEDLVDRLMGIAAKDVDADFLLRFADQLASGDPRYVDADGNFRLDPIQRRAHMYIQRARGTANEAFVMRSPGFALFKWNLGGSEENCPDCPELAAMDAVPYNELITTPGSCGTPCLTECNCYLTRDDGVAGFSKVSFAA